MGGGSIEIKWQIGNNQLKNHAMDTHDGPKNQKLQQSEYQIISFVQEFWDQKNCVQVKQQYPKNLGYGIEVQKFVLSLGPARVMVVFRGKNIGQQEHDCPGDDVQKKV
jgi:hypothetical protein